MNVKLREKKTVGWSWEPPHPTDLFPNNQQEKEEKKD